MSYLLIVGAGLRTALRTERDFEKLLAVGLTTIIGAQAFIIMAGVTKLVPLTGITLPFVSSGGSSLVSNYILIALLIRVSDSAARRVGELPDQPTTASTRGGGPTDEDAIEGVSVRALTDQLRARADVPDDVDGLLVVEIDAGSRAAREGLRRGDVILEVNTRQVTSVDAYRDALGQGEDRPILLRVYRPASDGRIFLAIPRG